MPAGRRGDGCRGGEPPLSPTNPSELAVPWRSRPPPPVRPSWRLRGLLVSPLLPASPLGKLPWCCSWEKPRGL
jgi:hypothetical protein